MNVFYPNLCYNKVCYRGAVLYLEITVLALLKKDYSRYFYHILLQ